MYTPLLLPDLRQMLDENDTAGLKEFCEALYPPVSAEVLSELPGEDVWRVLSHCSVERQAEIFAFLDLAHQMELVKKLDRKRFSRLLEQMPPDDRVDLLERLDPEEVEGVLPLIAQAEREDIRRLLSYPEHSAGSIMTTDYAALPENITVQAALEQLRKMAPDRETIYYVYILDADRRLRGMVSLRDLILAKPTTPISEIVNRDVISVQVDDDQEFVAQELAKYDFLAIPVVDHQNKLVGIVTHDDVLDVVVEEQTEDVQRMASIVPLDQNYLETSFGTVWQKRALWLSALFVAELFTFTALASFEEAIQAVLALTLFVPLCISTGGNSGSQAATLITRALAVGHVRLTDWWHVLRHELLMGLALGLTLGAIGFVRAALTPASVLGNADRWILALVISQAVAAICLWGTLVGSMMPLIFKRIGVDPGYASSPFVATFVDVTGIMIYFTIATAYLL